RRQTRQTRRTLSAPGAKRTRGGSWAPAWPWRALLPGTSRLRFPCRAWLPGVRTERLCTFQFSLSGWVKRDLVPNKHCCAAVSGCKNALSPHSRLADRRDYATHRCDAVAGHASGPSVVSGTIKLAPNWASTSAWLLLQPSYTWLDSGSGKM